MGKATQLEVSYADTTFVHSPSTQAGFALLPHMMHSIVVANFLREQNGHEDFSEEQKMPLLLHRVDREHTKDYFTNHKRKPA